MKNGSFPVKRQANKRRKADENKNLAGFIAGSAPGRLRLASPSEV
jgi:hypothetical protein